MISFYLTLVSRGSLLIEALPASSVTISGAVEIFTNYISPDFKEHGLDNEQRESGGMEVNVYELSVDADFLQMFKSLSSDLNDSCLTQSQIVFFCKKYSKFLHYNNDVSTTFFLFKENDKFFVAWVYLISGELNVDFSLLEEDKCVWSANSDYRLVVPARS